MGDIADMDADRYWDGFDEDFYSYPDYIKHPKCKGCGTKHIRWEKFKTKWFLVNDNGAPHRCGKYELPVEVLKELAIENFKKQKTLISDKIFKKSLSYNGVQKVLDKFLTNEQLLDLYTRWLNYAANDAAHNSRGWRIYDKKIDELKQELLKRLKYVE